MKTGQINLEALMEKLTDQENNKRDYNATTKHMEFRTDENKTSYLTIGNNTDNKKEFGITELAERQLAERLKIPAKYYD